MPSSDQEMDDILAQEAERLGWTVEKLREVAGDARLLMDALPSLYRDNPDLLNDLLLQTHNRIARLERAAGKPYFARIDFTEEGAPAPERCYIGKIGVSDADNRIVTVDWRAPVSTLYYDSSVGPVAYEAPGGTVRGALGLKRQIEIEDGKLLSVRDVDTVSNDELLAPYLGVNADNRLKNIVASIQGEQNRIIRERLERSLVVQGAAGSGKTTVALHRIAYLAYAYRDTIASKQYMVIGPNPYFLRYISSVLPDLDVDSVAQCTFAELARACMGEDFTLTDPYDALRSALAGADTACERHKTSMAYKEQLDRFLARFEETVPPREDFSLRGFVILPAAEVRAAWDAARVTDEGTVRDRAERCALFLAARVRKQRDAIETRLSDFFREQYRRAGDTRDLDRMHRDRAAVERELEADCRRSLRRHLSRADLKISALYRQFLQGLPQTEAGFAPAPELSRRTLALLRKKTLSPEDLAAVLYLHERVRGAAAYEPYRHTIVDEAQDYGAFELFVLRRVLRKSTFTVVGDLAQSIFGFRSVDSWETVVRDVFGSNAGLCEMAKSYRTTVEIMRAATRVTDRLGLNPAEAVIRHGAPVRLRAVEPERQGQAIQDAAERLLAEGCASVAVLCKTHDEAARLGERLAGAGFMFARAGEGADTSGVHLLTAYEAKGLEFDAVLIADASAQVYDSARPIDLHLLYVAMTRPLHRLDILCTGPLTEVLVPLAEECGPSNTT